MDFHYNSSYFPPAPFVDITIISMAELLRVGPLPAMVDSGADGTIVPQRYLDQIHAPPTVEMGLRSQWGERRRVMLYLVDIRIDEINLPAIEVVGDDATDEIILGRDVLNRLRILLNGPAGITNVSD